MKRSFGIAAIQLDAVGENNLQNMERLIHDTKRRYPWVQMIVFSELCCFGEDFDRAEPLPGPTEEHFCSLARKNGIWLIPGTFLEKEGKLIYNTLSVISPKGAVVARYRKVFPWLPYEEKFTPGDKFVTFDVPDVGRFGVLICYDVMIPETSRQLAFMGAEIILHPLMTTTLDRKQELVVAQACAIVNQCYFVDVNGAGLLGVGMSQVIGPEGEIVHRAGERQEIFPFRVDLEKVREIRSVGTAGTVQCLKAFRDTKVRFSAYELGARSEELEKLGPLVIPDQ